MGMNKYVSFDWAAKHLLRNKENFEILEGLIEVLLREKVHITEILESEGNQESEDDKFNRVDIKARDSKNEIIIVEIQLTRQLHYLERILYGVAKSITEHISLGESYDKVKKVYSISIVYFDLGHGSDYLYHGQTTFTGVTTGDTLSITAKEKDVLCMKTPESVFPEYFIIRVRQYDKEEAVNYLDEWLDFLRTGNINDDTQAPGLQSARKNLQYMQMSRAEQIAYDRHIDSIMVQNDVLSAAQKEAMAEGVAIGREKGKAEGIRQTAAAMKAEGMSVSAISRITGLDEATIVSL